MTPVPAGPGRARDAAVLGLVMLAFEGHELPAAMAARLTAAPAAGVTIFRYLNVRTPRQLRALTASVQRAAGEGAAPPAGPLLVAADQEGGQLIALGAGSTPFAGNMALGATGDPALAERIGAAVGAELRAMGVNVAYAPDCDLVTNPGNPGIGIRSFGADPAAVAALAAAMVRGFRSAGVAATAKHFPGLGDVGVDSHHEMGSVGHDRARLLATELVPFHAAIDAGAGLVMSGHVALPAVTGDPGVPATLSRAVMTDLLRGDLGFEGLSITDALDMAALPQADGWGDTSIAAVRAGVDLLLCAADAVAQRRVESALIEAATDGNVDPAAVAVSRGRLDVLRRWLAGFEQPPLSAVGSPAHAALARELAERSVTLVRDEAGILPLRLAAGTRILAVMPRPRDLTPADTSSAVDPGLASALRGRHPNVEEIVTGHPPTRAEIAAVAGRAGSVDLVVIGTIAASLDAAQADLVTAVLATATPTITVALRTPFDLAAYPAAATHACTYGILPPSMEALAGALFGRVPFAGRLPVAIPGIAPIGAGLTRPAA